MGPSGRLRGERSWGSWRRNLLVMVLLSVAWFAWRSIRGSLPPDGRVADPSTFVPEGLVTAQRKLPIHGIAAGHDGMLEWVEDAAWRIWGLVFERPSVADDSDGVSVVRTYHSDEGGAFEVIVDGRRLVAVTGARWRLLQTVPGPVDQGGDVAVMDAVPEPDFGSYFADEGLQTDVTGDGNPEIVLREWTGGAHCCFSLVVCQLVPELRVQRIDLGHGGAAFVPTDPDSAMALVVRDWSFASWETSFGCSPAPRVVLAFDGAEWKPSAALMREPPAGPDTSTLARWWKRFELQGTSGDRGDEAAPWGPLLDLIYSGNAREAWRLLDAAWPGDSAGARAFRQRLLQVMRGSPAWPALVELNGSALED